MTARGEVVAALAALVPDGITVLAYARDIDPPAQPTVMVRVDEVRPSAAQPWTIREYHFALLLVVPTTAPGPADDELDGLLEDVLHALDGSDLPMWSLAARATFADAYPAYQVDLTIPITKEPTP